jgi:hypothetical protein
VGCPSPTSGRRRGTEVISKAKKFEFDLDQGGSRTLNLLATDLDQNARSRTDKAGMRLWRSIPWFRSFSGFNMLYLASGTALCEDVGPFQSSKTKAALAAFSLFVSGSFRTSAKAIPAA